MSISDTFNDKRKESHLEFVNNVQNTRKRCAIISIQLENALDEEIGIDLPELGQDKWATCSAFEVHDKQAPKDILLEPNIVGTLKEVLRISTTYSLIDLICKFTCACRKPRKTSSGALFTIISTKTLASSATTVFDKSRMHSMRSNELSWLS